MTVADILAATVVTEILLGHALPDGRVFAGDHLHVADLAGPTGRAVTVVLVLVLHARGLILTGIVRAPVNVLVASSPRVTIWTMTSVILYMIVTGGSV